MALELTECNRYLLVERLAKEGLTLKQLAAVFDVSPETVKNWMESDEAFRIAWQRGRLNPDHLVEQALFRRAIGYGVVEIVEEIDDRGVVKKTKKTTKEMAPSELAQIFWLKNRLPHLWQERVHHDVTLRDLMELGHKNRRHEIADALEADGKEEKKSIEADDSRLLPAPSSEETPVTNPGVERNSADV